MTQLNKPVRRLSHTTTNTGRRLAVELRPGAVDTIFIREEGRRRGYSVPVEKAYALGARIEAEAAIKAKKDKRKKKGRDM